MVVILCCDKRQLKGKEIILLELSLQIIDIDDESPEISWIKYLDFKGVVGFHLRFLVKI